jgi:hypothetical protein
MFNLDNLSIRSEPFIVFYIRDLIRPSFYRELADAFPTLSLFRFRETLGNKYLLTESEGEAYHNFIRSSRPWRQFYTEIKSPGFREQVLYLLRAHEVDLEIGDGETADDFTVQFEFSALPTNGGSQRPHTDSPKKVVTLVLSLMREGEWDAGWGGGTTICKPRDETLYFNYANNYLDFNEVEIVDTFPFVPNACVMFVKTAVSWHCVMPINLPPNSPLRKTVAISFYRGGGA